MFAIVELAVAVLVVAMGLGKPNERLFSSDDGDVAYGAKTVLLGGGYGKLIADFHLRKRKTLWVSSGLCYIKNLVIA